MDVDLNERLRADATEAVNLACLDDEDITGTRFEPV